MLILGRQGCLIGITCVSCHSIQSLEALGRMGLKLQSLSRGSLGTLRSSSCCLGDGLVSHYGDRSKWVLGATPKPT